MSDSNDIRLMPIDHPIDATVLLPGSKSLTNRALLVAALAGGTTHVRHLLLADDTRIMLRALEVLGLRIGLDEASCCATVAGCGGHWPEDDVDIHCGNAGTVIRFLTAACCAGYGNYRLDGVPRMRQRPIGDLVSGLRGLGALIRYDGDEGFCPLSIRGQGLRGGDVHFHGTPSSQFVSALLMAAPLAAGDVYVTVTGELPSLPYVAMTLKVMEAFGVEVVHENMRKFIVPGRQTYASGRFDVEPDASAASYFFAAAALTGGRVTVEGLGNRSCQGDMAFVNVLERMGCQVEQGPDRTLLSGPTDGRLRAVDVDLGHMPDTAPTLAVLAAFAEGTTRIRNVANLRVKETDRINALSTELAKMNVPTQMHDDGLSIMPAGKPEAAAVDTYDDHRIAMSFALAGLRLENMIIRNADCVSKTFPDFFQRWAALTE
jgi:3-phosphoshikimate 1-carboxyvinyltransferase